MQQLSDPYLTYSENAFYVSLTVRNMLQEKELQGHNTALAKKVKIVHVLLCMLYPGCPFLLD